MGQAPETISFGVAQPKLKIHLFQFLMYITFHFSVVKYVVATHGGQEEQSRERRLTGQCH